MQKPNVLTIGPTTDNDMAHRIALAVANNTVKQVVAVDDSKIMQENTEKLVAAARESVNTTVPLDRFPKHNCRKCHGRGYIGTDTRTKEKIKCTCVFTANKATKIQGKRLTLSWD